MLLLILLCTVIINYSVAPWAQEQQVLPTLSASVQIFRHSALRVDVFFNLFVLVTT